MISNEYQTVRFTLLNHKEASAYGILSSLQFLVENKLMHKEWKRFEMDLFFRYQTALPNLLEKISFSTEKASQYHDQFLSVESVGELLNLFDRVRLSGAEMVVAVHTILLEKILSEIEVDDLMRREIELYDQMLAKRARATIVECLENAMQFLETREDAVSIVMDWYSLFTNPTLYSTEQR